MKSLVFAGVTRCTATSESLMELAEALELGGPSSMNDVLAKYNADLRVKPGQTNSFQERVLTLRQQDCPELSGIFRRLAAGSDRSEVSLAALGLLNLEVPLEDFDLVFYKLNHVVELKADYRIRKIGGGTWEGVLYHEPPGLEQFEKVRETVLNWCIPTHDLYEQVVYVLDGQVIVAQDIRTAHDRLLDSEDGVHQVNVYFEHPLVLPYASPYTSAKLWLYEEMSEVIISQHCSWSGDLGIDIKNFLSYRKVLRELAAILQAKAVAWGDAADFWPMEQTLSPSALDDVEALWELFVDGLEPMLGDVRVLSTWKDAFSERFYEYEV